MAGASPPPRHHQPACPELQAAFVAADGRAKLLFSDNSVLLLGAGRASFVHVSASGARTRQLCACVLRRFTPALAVALQFANLHTDCPAAPPCLVQRLPPGAAFELGYPIVDLCWPQDVEAALDLGLVDFLEEGRVALRSACGSGRLVLDGCRMRFAVCYPLMLGRDPEAGTHTYVWQTQAFSAVQHPPRWQAAVRLAQAVAASRDSGFALGAAPAAAGGAAQGGDECATPASTSGVAPWGQHQAPGAGVGGRVTRLPACLACADARRGPGGSAGAGAAAADAAAADGGEAEAAAVASDWLPDEGWWVEPCALPPLEEQVVLEWTPAATYTCIQASGEVEAWLHADDSCMATVQGGRFVQHYIPGEEDPRLYAAGAVPDAVTSMASGARLEVGAGVARALKLRSAMAAASAAAALSAAGPRPDGTRAAGAAACLPGSNMLAASGASMAQYAELDGACGLSTQPIEEQQVPGVGAFTAYADGRVKAVFADRTILHLDAAHATCRLLLPDGSVSQVAAANPVGVERYVQAGLEFAAWGFKTPAERAQVLRAQALVQAELQASARMQTICDWAAHGTLPSAACSLGGARDAAPLALPPDAGGAYAASPACMAIACSDSPSLLLGGSDTIPAYREGGGGCWDQCAETPRPWARTGGVPAVGDDGQGGGAELAQPGMREHLVRQLLSRNAEVLRGLQ